jgi:hypothetical protein
VGEGKVREKGQTQGGQCSHSRSCTPQGSTSAVDGMVDEGLGDAGTPSAAREPIRERAACQQQPREPAVAGMEAQASTGIAAHHGVVPMESQRTGVSSTNSHASSSDVAFDASPSDAAPQLAVPRALAMPAGLPPRSPDTSLTARSALNVDPTSRGQTGSLTGRSGMVGTTTSLSGSDSWGHGGRVPVFRNGSIVWETDPDKCQVRGARLTNDRQTDRQSDRQTGVSGRARLRRAASLGSVRVLLGRASTAAGIAWPHRQTMGLNNGQEIACGRIGRLELR